jgi:hypothetical protein
VSAVAEERYVAAFENTSGVGAPDGSAVHRIELVAWQGLEVATRAAADEAMTVWSGQLGVWLLAEMAHLALTVLELGLGQHAAALVHAR